MPVHITSLDLNTGFSELCETLVVNVNGAGVRSPSALAIATPVRLETADHRATTGWITDFEPLGHDAKWWLLGIALEQPANFWGVPNPPSNWMGQLPPVTPPPGQSPERKFSVWPGAYGPQTRTAAAAPLTLVPGKQPAAERPASAPPQPAGDPALLLSRLQADLQQRTEEHWDRMRSELEPQLTASTRVLQQEVQDSLAAWRTERAAVEEKLQDLLAVRDEVSARLDSIAGLLREQSAPLREEIIADARTQVDKLIGDFQEQLRGERRAVQTTQESLTQAVEEQLRTKTDAFVQQLRDRTAEELASLTSKAMDRVEQQLQANLGQAGEKLQKTVLQELQQGQQAASQAVAAHAEEMRSSEAGLRDRIRQLTDELSGHSERALAQLRVQVQELGGKQEQELIERLKKRDAASETALQTLAGRLLASAKEQLRVETEKQRQDIASPRALRTDMEKLERQAAELESHLTEVRQAREYIESLAKTLPETMQQRLSESVTAVLERMSGPAQEQFSQRAQEEIAALERRVHEVAERVGASTGDKLAAEAAQHYQQWRSSLTAGLSELQAQAAAVREEAARIAGRFEQQQQALAESANAKMQELAERESGFRQIFNSMAAGLEGKKQDIAASLQAIASDREQHLQQLLAESRQEIDVVLQRRAADVGAELQEQLRLGFQEGRKQFEHAQASAISQLKTLQERADHLTSMVDVELQKHADALIDETVAQVEQQLHSTSDAVRQEHQQKAQAEIAAMLEGKLQDAVTNTVVAASEQLQTVSAAMQRDQLSRAQAELDRLLGAVVQQAANAGSELRRAIESLHQDLAQNKLDSALIRSQVEQAQALLAQQTALFQTTLHDAFLQASAEIKGRIHQAVEMASEPLDRHGRDIQQQLTVAAQRMTQELQKQFATARDGLQAAATAVENRAEHALQERLADTMDGFRKDAENLARRSMERWQAAVKDTLAEIPQLLGNKLRDGQR